MQSKFLGIGQNHLWNIIFAFMCEQQDPVCLILHTVNNKRIPFLYDRASHVKTQIRVHLEFLSLQHRIENKQKGHSS